MTPEPKPGILEVSLYVGGRASVPGVEKVFKLSSNESPIGPSPKAMEALRAAAHDLELYPDGSTRQLREAIGQVHGLNPDRIVAGGGRSGPAPTHLGQPL